MKKYKNLIRRIRDCLETADEQKTQACQDFLSLMEKGDKENAELRRDDWLVHNAIATMLKLLLEEEV